MSDNVPDAETLIRLMSAWSSMIATKFHAAYPFFDPDRDRIIAEYELEGGHADLEATALLFAEYADDLYVQAIEAQRAETVKQGSVADESAVAISDAPIVSPHSTESEGE